MISHVATALVFLLPISGEPTVRTVSDVVQLRSALAKAQPGDTILLAPGRYPGGVSVRGLRGAPGKPIVVRGADPKNPPVFEGNDTGLYLSQVAHLELRDLEVAGSRGNGINIDDGGTLMEPTHHLLLKNITVRDIGPDGNRDGIKLSGVTDFRLEQCTVSRWGGGGSGVDMVGCMRGTIMDCTFRHGDETGDNAVQTKGGSNSILIQYCRFEHAGQRAVNLGGSTGLAFFRPKPAGFEAKNITVEDCTFVGSMAPIAFVGADESTVRHNTFYLPKRWAFRILQETRAPDFVPCRNGKFTDNLIVFRSEEMVVPVNIGDATDPQSFTLARNAWYCLDEPRRSRPRLPMPITETEGVYGIAPLFRNAMTGDFGQRPESPTRSAGVRSRR